MSTQSLAPLWNDLLVAVDKPNDGDFVHRLTSVVDEADSTVKSWVLTPDLRSALDQAATLVRGAASGGRSRACMLRGGFGSGKSHFMAVLSLLLQRDPALLNDDRFAHFHGQYREFGNELKFLTVHLHMLDAQSTESAVFSGYLQTIQRLHPTVEPPDLMALAPVIAMGQNLRASMGDALFLDALHGQSASSANAGGIGSLTALLHGAGVATTERWTIDRVNQAVGNPGSPDWQAFGKQLMRTMFSGVQSLAQAGARAGEDAWLSFDDGLALMSEHAKSLGYQGIVLFLDEHVLWLSGLASTPERLQREVEKLPKLVETGARVRPVPIVAFLAQQFDLDQYAASRGDARGAELRSLAQQLSHHRGRFEEIRLPTNGLPLIVEQRLLRPNPAVPDALDRIDAAWSNFYRKLPERHRRTLSMGVSSESEMRRIWPFSDVLMDALERLSDKLQRDRTALKLLTLLRWRYRDQLRLGDILPMGDLWPELDSGQDPVDEVSRAIFQRARRFYHDRALPWLLQRYQLQPEDLRTGVELLPETRQRLAAYRRDHLILSTLLVTALLPDWDVTRSLDVERLYALNYGAVGGRMMTGIETGALLRVVRDLADAFEEIVIGQENADNPSVSIRLTGIELEPLVKAARGHVSDTSLLGTVRAMLLKELNFANRSQSTIHYGWNATDCQTRLDFGNARAIHSDDDSPWLTSGDETRIFVDYPFDLRGFGSSDDHSRLDRWVERNPGGANTIVWLPRHLSEAGREALEKYAAMEYAEQEFNSLTASYATNDREPLRELLRLQRNQRATQVRAMLLAAYGLAQGDAQQNLRDDERTMNPLRPLRHDFQPQMPAVVNFGEAVIELGRQLQRNMHPQAPPSLRREPLRPQELQQLTTVLAEGFSGREPSFAVSGEKSLIPLLREVAVPLGLGQLSEGNSRFQVNESGTAELSRTLDSSPNGACTVEELRRAANRLNGQSRGLPGQLIDLVVRCWVLRNDIVLFNGTLMLEGADDSRDFHGSWVARHAALPDENKWGAAIEYAHKLQIFPHPSDFPYRTVRALHRLRDRVREWVQKHSWLPDLRSQLETEAGRAGLPTLGREQPKRLNNVVECFEIHARLRHNQAEPMALVEDVLGGRPSLVVDALCATLIRGNRLLELLNDHRMGSMHALRTAIENGTADPEDKEVVRVFDDVVFHAVASDLNFTRIETQLDAAQRRVFARSTAAARAPEPPPTPHQTAALHHVVHHALTPDEQPLALRAAAPSGETASNPFESISAMVGGTIGAASEPVRRGQRQVRSAHELDVLWHELRAQIERGRAVVLHWHDADDVAPSTEKGES